MNPIEVTGLVHCQNHCEVCLRAETDPPTFCQDDSLFSIQKMSRTLLFQFLTSSKHLQPIAIFLNQFLQFVGISFECGMIKSHVLLLLFCSMRTLWNTMLRWHLVKYRCVELLFISFTILRTTAASLSTSHLIFI